MKYEELQLMWENYDSKLDNLNKLDNQLIISTVLRRKQSRIQSLIKGNKFSLVCYILGYIIIIYSFLEKMGEMDWKLLFGIVVILLSMLDYFLLTKKRNAILREVKLKTDTIIESINKLMSYPKTRFKNLRHLVILYPIYLFGLTLIMWDNIIIDSSNTIDKVLFFLVLYFIGSLIGIPRYIQEKRKISFLIKELQELKDDEY
jgi:hypothetical protein